MRSIYKHLLKNMVLSIIVIYIVFITTFLINMAYSEYKQIKLNLQLTNYHHQSYLKVNLGQYSLYNQHINGILSKTEDTVLSAIPKLKQESTIEVTLDDLLDIFFENNEYFSNFMIFENQEVRYSYTHQQFDKLDFSLFNKLDKNEQILTNKFKPNVFTILYKHHDDVYFVYYFNQSKLNKLLSTSETDCLLIDKNNEYIKNESTYHSSLFNEDYGYSSIFKENNFYYFEKIDSELFGHDYYLMSHISNEQIISGFIESIKIPFLLTLLILALLIFIAYLKSVQIVKKPFLKFINEVESLEEKDFAYIDSIKHTKANYYEFYYIFDEFKKICLYNKNKYENTTQDLTNKLNQAQEENKSKSLFLANMSHEMRTPLNSIIGYTQLTQKVGFNSQKTKKYFYNIQNSSEILLQKINDILDLSKIQSKQFKLNEKPTKFVQVIKEIHDLLSIQAEKKQIEFTYYLDPQIPKFLNVDTTRLKQILINLCTNAIKFTEEGTVRLEVFVFGYTEDSVYLEYNISDTGCGIPKDQIDNIFVPFIQVDNNNNMQMGTGLGLTIARDLIHLMGGDINVISKENVGSIFNFITKMKISEQKSEEQKTIDVSNDVFKDKIKDKRILICEDNLINQIFIKEIFSVFNKKDIDIASDGYEAVEMCKETKYDLILMDIQMPRMDGIEATKIIKSLFLYQHVPIIALTANAFPEQIKEYLQSGMKDYLSKPVDLKRFKSVLVKNL